MLGLFRKVHVMLSNPYRKASSEDDGNTKFRDREGAMLITHGLPKRIALEPRKRSADVLEFEARLRRRIVGQDDAVAQLVSVYQTFLAGMSVKGRPVANLLLLGPTGSGKTHLVESTAEVLLGRADAFIKVDCAEFQHGHEIAKLIGSPPGYIGHKETRPMLTQEALDGLHTDKLKLGLVLFDEIEKANDSLWQLLLGVLDKAALTLGDNTKVDFSKSIVFMTSNLGASEIARVTSGGIGFAPLQRAEEAGEMDRKIYRLALEAAKRNFAPEFMNRIDKVVVFHTLGHDQLSQILEIELETLKARVSAVRAERPFDLSLTTDAREFLLSQGTDLNYGARHLKRAIEQHVAMPLSNLISTEQIQEGDAVVIDIAVDGNSLTFTKAVQNEGEPGASSRATQEMCLTAYQ